MFKITGAIAVMLSATLFGMNQYTDFLTRKKVLQSIRDGSVQVGNTLRCMCSPLHESFMCGGKFFISAAEKIACGTSPQEAVIESAKEFHGLRQEDFNIIERFAMGLCAQDCKGQITNIELFIKSLDIQITHASSELDTRGKLYVKGSILTAAAVVLLLI